MSYEVELPPVVEEFVAIVNRLKSGSQGIAHMAAEGRLGELAEGISDVAKAVEQSGYIPPKRRQEAARNTELAKSVSNRELALTYRARAKQAASQMGETL
jgi:hypothetical protein